MKIQFVILFITMMIPIISLGIEKERHLRIYGTVTDFQGKCIEGAKVEILNEKFNSLYQTTTNSFGKYELFVNTGKYLALMAVKDYKEKFLEFWAWNLEPLSDLQINPRIDGLELYCLNAFKPQGAFPSIMVYFRPMSLKRFNDHLIMNKSKGDDLIDISPEISKKDIEVTVNNKLVKILEVNKVREKANNTQSIIGYLIQIEIPKLSLPFETARISLVVNDNVTKEKGEALLFWNFK